MFVNDLTNMYQITISMTHSYHRLHSSNMLAISISKCCKCVVDSTTSVICARKSPNEDIKTEELSTSQQKMHMELESP